MPLTIRLVALVSLVLGVASCEFLPRSPQCLAAERCDQALDEPFGSFGANDEQFGDEGNCWLSGFNADACSAECDAFVATELREAELRGDNAAILACGGSLDNDDGNED
jgi:hypothetical protein